MQSSLKGVDSMKKFISFMRERVQPFAAAVLANAIGSIIASIILHWLFG